MDLRTARERARLTQRELAVMSGVSEESGVSEIAISLLENKKTVAQNGTRRKLEKALGVRVNWLKTMGLKTRRQGEMTSWEFVEQDFRKALYGIKSLQKGDQLEFLKLAKQYLREFEREEIKSGVPR